MGGLEGWHGEAEFNNGPTTGFVCTEQRADKCRLLLSIYTLLHSPAHVHLTQKCTHSDASAVALVCFFASLSPSKTHRLTHSYRHTHAACVCLQCISVSVSLRVRGNDRKAPASTSVWQKPGHYVTLQARLCESTETEVDSKREFRKFLLQWQITKIILLLLLSFFFDNNILVKSHIKQTNKMKQSQPGQILLFWIFPTSVTSLKMQKSAFNLYCNWVMETYRSNVVDIVGESKYQNCKLLIFSKYQWIRSSK